MFKIGAASAFIAAHQWQNTGEHKGTEYKDHTESQGWTSNMSGLPIRNQDQGAISKDGKLQNF